MNQIAILGHLPRSNFREPCIPRILYLATPRFADLCNACFAGEASAATSPAPSPHDLSGSASWAAKTAEYRRVLRSTQKDLAARLPKPAACSPWLAQQLGAASNQEFWRRPLACHRLAAGLQDNMANQPPESAASSNPSTGRWARGAAAGVLLSLVETARGCPQTLARTTNGQHH